MIPKISRGADPVGLLRYLIGNGARDEHVDPHLIAGSAMAMVCAGRRRLQLNDAGMLGRYIDEPHRQFAKSVLVIERDQQGRKVGTREAHIWHCPLSLHSDEPALSDERWAQIARRLVQRMGFADDARGRCRWVAVRHGPSTGGNDHVHLVVGLVCENGRSASVHNDRPRVQQACRELEREFGLRVVEGRDRGAGARGYATGELESDRRRGMPVGKPGAWAPEHGSRQTLERIVRAVATASATEEEFVCRLRAERILVRARFAKGSRETAVGYAVALRPRRGEQPVWYPGGQLSRELTLPRLRCGWAPTDGPVPAWQSAATRRAVRPASPDLRRACVVELAALRESLRQVAPDDHARWAQVAGDSAAVFAAWSLRLEPRAGPLAAAARSLARSAQIRTPPPRRDRWSRSPLQATAQVVLDAGAGPSNRALLVQLANLAKAIHDMHRAQAEQQRAAELAHVLRPQLSLAAELVDTGDLMSSPVRSGAALHPQDERNLGR